jgi:hypothetical protein
MDLAHAESICSRCGGAVLNLGISKADKYCPERRWREKMGSRRSPTPHHSYACWIDGWESFAKVRKRFTSFRYRFILSSLRSCPRRYRSYLHKADSKSPSSIFQFILIWEYLGEDCVTSLLCWWYHEAYAQRNLATYYPTSRWTNSGLLCPQVKWCLRCNSDGSMS